MVPKHLLFDLGKLLLCGVAFFVATIIGGMVAALLQLQPPLLPEEVDVSIFMPLLLLASPLLVLALAILARNLAGRFLTRTLILGFLTWIVFSVNNQLEASIFSVYAAGFWFNVVSFLVPSLLCSAMVAWLFPSTIKSSPKTFFCGRAAGDWIWRLLVAAVAFMPVYFFFGLLVMPFTVEYYRQDMYGLQAPAVDQILVILSIRSVLFLLACLPVLVIWQGSARNLLLRLGFALFVLVGFLPLFTAYWLPLSVRLPHSVEILADEFVYAGALIALLVKRRASSEKSNAPLRQL